MMRTPSISEVVENAEIVGSQLLSLSCYSWASASVHSLANCDSLSQTRYRLFLSLMDNNGWTVSSTTVGKQLCWCEQVLSFDSSASLFKQFHSDIQFILNICEEFSAWQYNCGALLNRWKRYKRKTKRWEYVAGFCCKSICKGTGSH